MIDLLGDITYPAWAAVSFCSCAMRLVRVWVIWHFDQPTEQQRMEAKKLLVLAITNFFMLVAFSLITVALQYPDLAQTVRPYRITAWAIGLPIYAYSVVLKFQEILKHQDYGD